MSIEDFLKIVSLVSFVEVFVDFIPWFISVMRWIIFWFVYRVRMAVPKCLISVLFLGLLPVTLALIENLEYPTPYAQCLYSMWKKSRGIKEEVALSIYHQCISNYRWKTSRFRNFAAKNVTGATVQYTGSLIRSALGRVAHGQRRRRQGLDLRRERIEYRMMTDDQRNRYHSALNRLKYDEKVSY